MPKLNKKKTSQVKKGILTTNKIALSIGVLFIVFSVVLLISFISFYINGAADQSVAHQINNTAIVTKNSMGKIGAFLAQFFVFDGFGITAFIFVKTTFVFGLFFMLDYSYKKLVKHLCWDIYLLLVLSLFFGGMVFGNISLGGTVGFQVFNGFKNYLGAIGTYLLVFLLVFLFIVLFFEHSVSFINLYINKLFNKKSKSSVLNSDKNDVIQEDKIDNNVKPEEVEVNCEKENSHEIAVTNETVALEEDLEVISEKEDFVIKQVKEDELEIAENLAEQLVHDFGEFDPTLDLPNYKFPTNDLLVEHQSAGITINQAELEANKNRIVETLLNYKIGISKITATVGPTVTLYEIVPEPGIRISKIKNLEDDIALSLAALGIRIIAPIPGKGTIGIEVPSTSPSIVGMKSLISSKKFQTTDMELPVALGKTISNETFIVDLAKMPHLLMAGATGQGKSVGLNVVLTSLLYKKHPAEVKFILVDPKKVELTLFNKIERHYLAKLPDTEEAIITDNAKVINTLNSLCIEMDNRYDLLKDAMVRNIKEYNHKFKQRKLNPENGHRFLPYIVLVVDEFADLIMTAGKEVETPIARLAQLARAIGIHLVIATQRPSVNVITGIIKANFPSRIAFRVTSKIDSRTILDSSGADQLVGRGDMLYTQGTEPIRVQCAFVDTPEIEKLTEYIGSQKAYSDAYLLPEYIGEEGGINLDVDVSERDKLFREAAEVIVTAQQGSTSLLQRKLKLGYNRAGRIIDQLEAAGIVGPFEGSKARSVLITDLVALDDLLNN